MSDSSRDTSAIVYVSVVAGHTQPFDDGLAETQPIDLADVNPSRRENLT
jgi:hypothetical protein